MPLEETGGADVPFRYSYGDDWPANTKVASILRKGFDVKAFIRWVGIVSFGLLTAPARGEPVDSATCRSCHRQIYDRYAATPMGRSLYVPSGAPVIEDWDRNNRIHHEPSARYYEMTRRDGQLFIRRYQQDAQNRQINSLELRVTHIMGSGIRARSYLHRTAEGRMIELPVSWYSQEGRWAMAPGYDRPQNPDFTRSVNHKCMFCHNAYPDVPASRARQGWDSDVRFPAKIPAGIDCQRCHGDGGRHVRDGLAKSIVNPARLDLDRQLEICMQCHLESTSFRLPDSLRRFGRGFYSYRPGEPLGDYIVHFDHAPGSGQDDKFQFVSSAYRLQQSACFLKSEGRLVCTTCHDAHTTVDTGARTDHYRQRCLQCHSSGVAKRHNLNAARFAKSDCLPCHMPLRRTEDVVHGAMTDHRIARQRPDGDLLAPVREKTNLEQLYRGPVAQLYPRKSSSDPLDAVYLGIAQVKEGANLQAGVGMLEHALQLANPRAAEPYFELAEAQVALGFRDKAKSNYLEAIARDPEFFQAENNLGNLLASEGLFKEAIARYRRALTLDPGDAQILINLGLTLIDASDRPAAEAAFRRAIAAEPLSAGAWRELGTLLLVIGAVAPSRVHLERAVVLNPLDAKAQNNLAHALIALGQPDLAVPYLQFAIQHGDRATSKAASEALKRIRVVGGTAPRPVPR